MERPLSLEPQHGLSLLQEALAKPFHTKEPTQIRSGKGLFQISIAFPRRQDSDFVAVRPTINLLRHNVLSLQDSALLLYTIDEEMIGQEVLNQRLQAIFPNLPDGEYFLRLVGRGGPESSG